MLRRNMEGIDVGQIRDSPSLLSALLQILQETLRAGRHGCHGA